MAFEGEFDAVICLCQGAFGMMTADGEDDAVVAGMARALRMGGRLALSAFNDSATVNGLLDAGAAGYLPKDQHPAVVREAVLAVHRGEGRWFVPIPRRPDVLSPLTGREHEVLVAMARGLDNGAIAERLRGKKLPLLDRVEISIIEEAQPRWLSFLNKQHDYIDRLPNDFIEVAMPARRVAPNLVKQGVRGVVTLMSDVTFTYFNMTDPVVGGMAPHQVALRRAIGLGVDVDREIRLLRRGMAIPAQSPVMPHLTGYDTSFKSEMSEYNPPRAKALLDMHGYIDKNGDGWRESPDGKPLILEISTQPDGQSRQQNELWKKNMDALRLRMVFKTAKWPENLKAGRAGKLQIWALASGASGGDGQGMITRYFGPQAGNQNIARFKHPAMDAIHEKMTVLPDGPERLALFQQAKKLAVAYMPYKLHSHRLVADLMHPEVHGIRRPLFWNEWWHFVDVEPVPFA